MRNFAKKTCAPPQKMLLQTSPLATSHRCSIWCPFTIIIGRKTKIEWEKNWEKSKPPAQKLSWWKSPAHRLCKSNLHRIFSFEANWQMTTHMRLFLTLKKLWAPTIIGAPTIRKCETIVDGFDFSMRKPEKIAVPLNKSRPSLTQPISDFLTFF